MDWGALFKSIGVSAAAAAVTYVSTIHFQNPTIAAGVGFLLVTIAHWLPQPTTTK